MAMLSYANFGSDKEAARGTVNKVREAVKTIHEQYPDYVLDGEMQVNVALDKDLRDTKYPFNKIKGQTVNTLIFPCLSSANTTCKMLLEMGVGESIGPVQMGLNKPVHFTDSDASVHDIFNLTVAAVKTPSFRKRRTKKRTRRSSTRSGKSRFSFATARAHLVIF